MRECDDLFPRFEKLVDCFNRTQVHSTYFRSCIRSKYEYSFDLHCDLTSSAEKGDCVNGDSAEVNRKVCGLWGVEDDWENFNSFFLDS